MRRFAEGGACVPESPHAPVEVSKSYRRYVLAVLVAVFTFSHIDRQILSILLEPIKHDLGLSDTGLGFLTGIAFALFYATLGMPIAMWADRGNRRTIIALSLAVWSGMTALCGLATTFWQLALARIGVGVGEAGGNAPAHALISDYYPPAERATALAVYSLGVPFGVFAGFLIGGWVNELIGWRAAFLVVGLPGLLLALIVQLTMRELPRGYAEGLHVRTETAPPFRTVLRFLWSQPAARQLIAGGALFSAAGYAIIVWTPAFLVRVHGMSTGEVGTALALIIGAAGAIGTYLGGYLSDRLARHDIRWRSWVVAIPALVNVPFVCATYLVDDVRLALLLFVIPAMVAAMYIGPTFAMIQSLARVRMRTVAASIMLFVANLIGAGLGPQVVGIISDVMADDFGQHALRYGLAVTSLFYLWSALHYFLTARHLEAGVARAAAPLPAQDEPHGSPGSELAPRQSEAQA